MFLPKLSKLLAMQPRPWIIYIVTGLMLGAFTVAFFNCYQAYRLERKLAAQRACQNAPTLINDWMNLVFFSKETNPEIWREKIYSLMSRKAQAKFDDLFLGQGEELFLKKHIAHAPHYATDMPYPVNSRPHMMLLQDRRGARVNYRLTLISVSRWEMRVKEFVATFKVREKHGRTLITDMWIEGDPEGEAFKKYLSEAKVIDSQAQFNNNIGALNFYYVNPYCFAPKLTEEEDVISAALELNAEFSLAHFNRAQAYIKNKKFDLAIKDLDVAIAANPEFEDFKILRDLAIKKTVLPEPGVIGPGIAGGAETN